MKLTIEFAPGDRAVGAAIRQLIPPELLNDFLIELAAKTNSEEKSGVAIENRELSYLEALDLLHEVERLVGRIETTHGKGCQALLLRRSDLCDCNIGKLRKLTDTFRLRRGGAR